MNLISDLLKEGWQIDLYYLWIPNAEVSVDRVSDRVALGGHDIPKADIIRRYPRSVYNFVHCYMPLCATTTCIDNSGEEPTIIFTKKGNGEADILQRETYNLLRRIVKNE